jgi:hypothetical protein
MGKEAEACDFTVFEYMYRSTKSFKHNRHEQRGQIRFEQYY